MAVVVGAWFVSLVFGVFGVRACLVVFLPHSFILSLHPCIHDYPLLLFVVADGTVSFFNLDTSYVLPPECNRLDNNGDSTPSQYNLPVFILGSILSVTLLQASIFAIGIVIRYTMTRESNSDEDSDEDSDGGDGGCFTMPLVCAELQGKLFVVMSFCFPLVTKQVYHMLHCQIDASTGINYLVWSGGASGKEGEEVVECYVGEHLSVAVLAWMVIVFYLVFYPVATFLYLHFRIIPALIKTGDSGLDFRHSIAHSIESESAESNGVVPLEEHRDPVAVLTTNALALRQNKKLQNKKQPLSIKSIARLTRWDHFVSDDYSPKYFYFRHIYYCVYIVLLGIYEYVDRSLFGDVRCIVIVVLFGAYLALLFIYRPFNEMDRWKLYVRVCLIMCSILIAVLDVVRWTEGEALADAEAAAAATNPDDAMDPTMTILQSPSPSMGDDSSTSSTSNGGSSGGSGGGDDIYQFLPYHQVSLVVSYILFAACMLLVVVLPLSFFVVNYGTCSWLCGWLCRNRTAYQKTRDPQHRRSQGSQQHRRDRTRDHISLDATNEEHGEEGYEDEFTYRNPSLRVCQTRQPSVDIEMTHIENDYYSEEEGDDSSSGAEPGWQRHFDDSTGFYYLYNASTGETKWEDYEVEEDEDNVNGTLSRVESFRSQPALVRVESFRSESGEERTVVRISGNIAKRRDSLLEKARELSITQQKEVSLVVVVVWEVGLLLLLCFFPGVL